MKITKLLSAFCAAAMLLAVCTACKPDSESAPSGDSSAVSKEPAETSAASAADESSNSGKPVFEKQVIQHSGEAALYITDKKVFVQYWGTEKDVLSYDAGVAKITGNGTYTVSVNAGTKGAQYDISNGTATEGYVCSGLGMMGIVIKGGEALMPDAVLTVDSILVDGKEVKLTGKNYTYTQDGNIRTNINNPYISKPSGDARSTEGRLFLDNDPAKPALTDTASYSPHIVNTDDFKSWTKVEVTFTVTGMPENRTESSSAE